MSHENREQPDWDRDDLAKRAPLDARLADMVAQHLDDDPMWASTVKGFADDLVDNDEVRELLASVCVVVATLTVYCHRGRAEAIQALKNDCAQLRRIAAKGADE